MRSTIPLILVILLLTPPALPVTSATHETGDGPPASTFGWLGGARGIVAINAQPQELDPSGAPTFEDAPGRQRLVTTGTYDCLTGAPSSAPDASPYSFDVVPLAVASRAVGLDDHAGDYVHAFAAKGGDEHEAYDNPRKPATVPYGADVYLGTGAERAPLLAPGLISFQAHVSCGGSPVRTLPAATGHQVQGIFGFLDEGEVGNGLGSARSAWSPELAFYYQGSGSYAGETLPGDVTLTPGWFLTDPIPWDGSRSGHVSTFRFVVNPPLVELFPGYSGSLFKAEPRECLTSEEGLSGACTRPSTFPWPSRFAHPDPFVEGPGAGMAPALEDVDRYGVSQAEPAFLEAHALAAPTLDAVGGEVAALRPIPGRSMEPDLPGETWSVAPAGAGWAYYLDVTRETTVVGTGLLAGVPLWPATADLRGIYPGAVTFVARLGLARDANGDGAIDFSSRAEWYAIDDYLSTPTLDRVANFGDVGSLQDGGSALLADEPLEVLDLCHFGHLGVQRSRYEAFTPVPLAAEDEHEMEECATYGDSAAGWGTFRGGLSAEGNGLYTAETHFVTEPLRSGRLWSTSVEARVAWPSLDEWRRAGIAAPPGIPMETLAGTTLHLSDVDVYTAGNP